LTRKDRSDDLGSAGVQFVQLFERLSRIFFILLAVLVLRTPYEVLIAFILPGFFEYRMIPWVLIWLFIFYLSLRKDNFISTVKEFVNNPVVKDYMSGFIANTIFFIRNKWQNSTLLAKLIFFGVILLLIRYFFIKHI